VLNILQGSVATRLRILKISQHLAKLWARA